MKEVTGTLVSSYFVCKREVWFMAHELIPDQDNAFLEVGRAIEENFYSRESKGFDVGNLKIDLVREENEATLIGEIKKSSRYEKSEVMQLAFYLLKFKEEGVISKGEVLIPKERRKIPVTLTEEIKNELNEAIEDIERIIIQDRPPQMEKIKFCTNCAYREFCFS